MVSSFFVFPIYLLVSSVGQNGRMGSARVLIEFMACSSDDSILTGERWADAGVEDERAKGLRLFGG